MKNLITRTISILLLSVSTAHAADPLPSWRNEAAKQSIISFINKTTQTGSPDFVPLEEWIAVFDNDGTLWSEQPNYVQLVFAIDRVKELAPNHPEWRVTQPFQAVPPTRIQHPQASVDFAPGGEPRITLAYLWGYFLFGRGRVGLHGLGDPQDAMHFKRIN